MYVGITVGFLLSWPPSELLAAVMVYGGCLLLLGIYDDLIGLPAIIRLLVEVLLTLAVLTSLPQLIVTSLPFIGSAIDLGWFSLPFTVFLVVGIINAFNMMDGIDGLAAVGFILSLGAVGVLSAIYGSSDFGLFVSVVVLSLILFLSKNLSRRERRKILLGDSGCLMLGGITAMLMLQVNTNTPEGLQPGVLGGLLLALPLLDMLAVASGRIARKRSPFAADRSHIHHLLVDGGVGSLRALIILMMLMSGLALVGVITFQLSSELGFVSFSAMTIIYARNRKKMVQNYLSWRNLKIRV